MYLNYAWEFYFCSCLVPRELGGFPRRRWLVLESWLNPGLYLPWSGAWVLLETPKVARPSACGWGRRWQRKRWGKEKQILSYYRGTGNEEWVSELLECLEALDGLLLGIWCNRSASNFKAPLVLEDLGERPDPPVLGSILLVNSSLQ